MVASKQCSYRKQEHECTHPSVFKSDEQTLALCHLCLAGQQVDAIELVASAIMEKGINKLENSVRKSCSTCMYYYGEWKECETCNENSKYEARMERVMK